MNDEHERWLADVRELAQVVRDAHESGDPNAAALQAQLDAMLVGHGVGDRSLVAAVIDNDSRAGSRKERQLRLITASLAGVDVHEQERQARADANTSAQLDRDKWNSTARRGASVVAVVRGAPVLWVGDDEEPSG